jgi:Flp pilus assembly protein TadG
MKIKPVSLLRRLRSGAAAVELAVVSPMVVALIIGLLTVGRIVQMSEILANAAREGARKASTGINTYADVQTTIANYLTNAGVTNQTGLVVSVTNVTQGTGPTANPSSAVCLDQLQINITLPYSNIRLAPLPMPAGTVVSGQAVWFSNQDVAYPTNLSPPPGS